MPTKTTKQIPAFRIRKYDRAKGRMNLGVINGVVYDEMICEGYADAIQFLNEYPEITAKTNQKIEIEQIRMSARALETMESI